jgi:SAM-dependent methyltransferase
MIRKTRRCWPLFLALNVALALAQEQHGKALREPDVIFVPTPEDVVEQMIKLANVHKGDVVYDLGCGDGRTVIAAAKLPGVRGVGIDISPERIKESIENARQAGVMDRVTFREEDLFEADIKDATVVMLYLLPRLNLKLRPKLWRELKPGTRIVSHDFDMDDWKPEQELHLEGHTIYFWTIPAKPPLEAK